MGMLPPSLSLSLSRSFFPLSLFFLACRPPPRWESTSRAVEYFGFGSGAPRLAVCGIQLDAVWECGLLPLPGFPSLKLLQLTLTLALPDGFTSKATAWCETRVGTPAHQMALFIQSSDSAVRLIVRVKLSYTDFFFFHWLLGHYGNSFAVQHGSRTHGGT